MSSTLMACYSDACGDVGRTSTREAWEVDDAQYSPGGAGGDPARGSGGRGGRIRAPGDPRAVRAVRAHDRRLEGAGHPRGEQVEGMAREAYVGLEVRQGDPHRDVHRPGREQDPDQGRA